MPLYEYQCQQCSDRVEIIQNLSDPPHSHCAKCGGEMKKLFSSPAIQFKGSGFYKTDYPSGKSSQSGDSKPAASTETKTSETKTSSSDSKSSSDASASKKSD